MDEMPQSGVVLLRFASASERPGRHCVMQFYSDPCAEQETLRIIESLVESVREVWIAVDHKFQLIKTSRN